MAKSSPTKPVDDRLTESKTGARVHEYQISKMPLLERAVEQTLSAQIQRGNLALHELEANIASAIVPHLQKCDLQPLKADEVLAAVSRVIREQLVKCGGTAAGRAGFVEELSLAIYTEVAEVLEHADPRYEFDVETWLTERLPLDGLKKAMPVERCAPPDLWKALEQREAAINTLVESHLRMAKPFAMKVMRQPFEFGDLMNEAFLILRRAAERFDATTNNRFSSYAGAALQRELKRQSPSRIGIKRHTAVQLKQFNEAQRTLGQKRGSSPAIDDVYQHLACSERTRTQIENVRRILTALRRSQQKVESTLPDPIDPLLQDPSVEAGDREEAELLQVALEKLNSLERNVVIGKCILGSSFRQMAKRYRKSASTLRDAFADAMTKLARCIDSKWKSNKPR